jgi:hypothetical protein
MIAFIDDNALLIFASISVRRVSYVFWVRTLVRWRYVYRTGSVGSSFNLLSYSPEYGIIDVSPPGGGETGMPKRRVDNDTSLAE